MGSVCFTHGRVFCRCFLQELLADTEREGLLLKTVEAAKKKAVSVLEGARRRGMEAGEVMSPEQQRQMEPFIEQEAFAREVVSAMKLAAAQVWIHVSAAVYW